ncbi:MAG: hypothetical protein [Bacteriophage sp.]|nr:MAG: hypothetical protein [Bacteriophage sp.]
MVNEQVIERLQRGDWGIECNNAEEVDAVLYACDEAGINSNGKGAIIKWLNDYPVDIGYCEWFNSVDYTHKKRFEILNLENIKDWFFSSVKGVKQ